MNAKLPTEIKRILVIRRDNIGDLLCTTPLLAALRDKYPSTHIALLVNSYNAPVVERNPHIDELFIYTKAKHSGHIRLASWWNEWALYRRLRRERFDVVLHANPTPHERTARLARFLRAASRIGVVADLDKKSGFNIPIATDAITGTHHVERVFSLGKWFGIDANPGPMILAAEEPPPHLARQLLQSDRQGPLVAIHISSRKPCNRWPKEHFKSLVEQLGHRGIRTLLLWAPGTVHNRQHPGDDETAAWIVANSGDCVVPAPTQTLVELIGSLACARAVICADGGALHIASALGKPVVALFGCTDSKQWGPWQVPCRILEGYGQANRISLEAVTQAINDLLPAGS